MGLIGKVSVLAMLGMCVAGCNMEKVAEQNAPAHDWDPKNGALAPMDEYRFSPADSDVAVTDEQALTLLTQSMKKMENLSRTMAEQFEAAAELEDNIPIPGDFKFNKAIAPAGFYTVSFAVESIAGLLQVDESSGVVPVYLKERNGNVINYSIDPIICDSNIDCEFIVANLELVQTLSSVSSGKLAMKHTNELADFIGIKVGGGVWDFAGYSDNQWFIEMSMQDLWSLYVTIERAKNNVVLRVPEVADGRVRYVLNEGGEDTDDTAIYAVLEEIVVDGHYLPGSVEKFKANYKPGNIVHIAGGAKADDAYFVRCDPGTMSVELVREKPAVAEGEASLSHSTWITSDAGIMEAKIRKYSNVTLKRGVFSNYHIGFVSHYVDGVKTSTYETTEDSAVTIVLDADPAASDLANKVLIQREGQASQAGKQILIIAEDLESKSSSGKTVEIKFVRTGADKLMDGSQAPYLADAQFNSHWEVYMEHFRLGENNSEAGSMKLIIPNQAQMHQSNGAIERVVDENNELLLNENGDSMLALVPGDYVMDTEDAVLLLGNGALDTYIRTTASQCSLPDTVDDAGSFVASTSSDCLAAIFMKYEGISGN